MKELDTRANSLKYVDDKFWEIIVNMNFLEEWKTHFKHSSSNLFGIAEIIKSKL
jgi:hypothetical protein